MAYQGRTLWNWPMNIITTTAALAEFCARAMTAPYVTVDTEFLRERTYFAKLCLLQMALPGTDDSDAVIVDPLADGIDLAPVIDLFRHPGTVKVFHAARQDIEIFCVEYDVIPAPLFDTQVAAMVCGFGEQAGYETLVRKIAKAEVDKSSRFTDWSRRPLSDAQLTYALADVTHLRQIYETLSGRLKKTGRASWVAEEMAILNDPATYRTDPATAWEKIKTRTSSPKFLGLIRELARFREEYAMARDVPRSRVFKDDALVEVASLRPQTEADLQKARLLLREGRKPEVMEGILAAVKQATALRPEDLPLGERRMPDSQINMALADLLRVLLKARSEAQDVAPRLIASAADLDALAAGDRNVPALQGWRYQAFGEEALLLCSGQVALTARGQSVVTVRV
jgi:ribonuclease D